MSRTALKSDLPHVKAAFADLGLSEIIGKKHERRVLALYADAGHPEVKDDETAWCAAGVGAWLHRGRYPNSGSLMARSYVKYGVACDLKKKVPRGAIAVWPRGKPPSGHVNIVLDDDGTFLTCIGGNQSNGSGGGVTISRERKIKAIACRMPPGVKPVVVDPVPMPKPKPVVQDDEEPITPQAAPSDAPPVPPAEPGDPGLVSVQRRLKAMNYNPGIPNGTWGGMMAGAIGGFANDRHLDIAAPTSFEMFAEIHDELVLELSRAEAENWKRPVSEERAKVDPTVVAEVAPEVVPTKRNFLVAAWGSVVTFVVGIYNAVSDQITAAWNFFTDHKDDLPTDSGILNTVWGYIGKVPTLVWVVAAAAGLAYLAFNSSSAVKRINESVKTGARQ